TARDGAMPVSPDTTRPEPHHGQAFQTLTTDLLRCPNTRSGGRADAPAVRDPTGSTDYAPATADLDPGWPARRTLAKRAATDHRGPFRPRLPRPHPPSRAACAWPAPPCPARI